VWVVVRRYLLPGDEWTSFALRPGMPSELGFLISPFVHLEPTHLGINLLVLWLFGTTLERAVGPVRFLVVYLGAAWFAALMHWAAATAFHVAPNLGGRDAAIGSSGAIAGLLGTAVVRLPFPRIRLPFFGGVQIPTTPIIIAWLVYSLVRALISSATGVVEGVGHWAHLAGFVCGLGLAQLMGLQKHARQEYLEQAALEAASRENLVGAAQAWAALLAMRPEDRTVRAALIQARAALNDTPGARRLAREGLVSLARADQRAAATQAYREWLEVVPDIDLPAGVRYRIGCWLAEAGEDELAFRALWESVREDGSTAAAASALYRAGQVAWERLRSPMHAREAWERLLEQFPDSPWSDKAREGLRGLAAVPDPGI
jgi:membrane associated rhomboid family serine protease